MDAPQSKAPCEKILVSLVHGLDSLTPLNNIMCEKPEGFCTLIKSFKSTDCIIYKFFCFCACTFKTKNRGIRRLCVTHITSHIFSNLFFSPFEIENVIRNLKSEPNGFAIFLKRIEMQ